RLALDGLGAGEHAAWLDELARRERGAAVLALVAVGVGVAADGARPAHEPVGEEQPGLGVEQLPLRLLDEGAVGVEAAEEVLARGVMDGGGRAAVVVEGDAEAAEGLL